MEVDIITKKDLMDCVSTAINKALQDNNILQSKEKTDSENILEPDSKDQIIKGIKGLASFLGVSVPTAIRIREIENLPYFQYKNIFLFKKDDVLRMISKQKK